VPKQIEKKGRQLPDGTLLIIEPEGGINKMRCMRCKVGTTASVKLQNGKTVNRCTKCGATYGSRPMR
jgi:NAD-dependent SIR2 family protein deacetylase